MYCKILDRSSAGRKHKIGWLFLFLVCLDHTLPISRNDNNGSHFKNLNLQFTSDSIVSSFSRELCIRVLRASRYWVVSVIHHSSLNMITIHYRRFQSHKDSRHTPEGSKIIYFNIGISGGFH